MQALLPSLPLFLRGILTTLYLAIASTALATALGIVFSGVQLFAWRPLKWLVEAYLYLVRGIPLLVLLFAMYYALPYLGLQVDAVAGGVVSDMVSMYGTCDDGAVMGTYELGAPPWEAPGRYAAMSPLTHVHEVSTPTLVLHGRDDLTCPLGQAQQWHTSLRVRGVPTELVVYPDASHVFPLLGTPSQRADYGLRVVGWLEQYVERDGRPRVDRAHWQRRA